MKTYLPVRSTQTGGFQTFLISIKIRRRASLSRDVHDRPGGHAKGGHLKTSLKVAHRHASGKDRLGRDSNSGILSKERSCPGQIRCGEVVMFI